MFSTKNTRTTFQVAWCSLFALAAVMNACDRPSDVSAPPSRLTFNRAPYAGHVRPSERGFAELAKAAPSGAGYYLDSEGHLVAVVADTLDAPRARAALQDIASVGFTFRRRSIVPSVIVKKGDFDFAQLATWRDTITASILGRDPGVVFDDVDEVRNRVTLGILGAQSSAREQDLITRLGLLGVPAAALHFEYVGPNRVNVRSAGSVASMPAVSSNPNTTLTSFTVPMIGGTRIIGTWPNIVSACTGGFVVSYSGHPGRFLVTNSHCTEYTYQQDSTQFWQPRQSNPVYNDTLHHTGHEAFDKIWTQCGTQYCRGSDASLVALDDSVSSVQGSFAQPASSNSGGWSGGAGTLNISTTHPVFTVVALSLYGDVVGADAEKVGSATGWTYGSVTRTCADEAAGNYVRTCQNHASYYTEDGDSGSPVFGYKNYPDGVQLNGIHWGQTSDNLNHANGSIYSPWTNIDSDYGGGYLNPYTQITVSSPALSGSKNSNNDPALTWTASATTNTTATTQYYVFRDTWSASSQSWTEYNNNLAVITSTSYTDLFPTDTAFVYYGGTRPDSTQYNYSRYHVTAYNLGVVAYSNQIYFGHRNVF